MNAPSPTLSLKARALRHLARREHTRVELERKLTAHLSAARRAGERGREAAPGGSGGSGGPGPRAADVDIDVEAAEQVRRTLDELAAHGLLSDERAAESMLASQGSRFGSRRLKQTLLAKGLAPDLVRSTVQQSRATEYERAQDLWRRRFGQTPSDPRERARQIRFLAGRGFDADVIRRIVGNTSPPDAEG
ncbi:MAG: regulatory protein RecX [Burkholderiales bacterium]|nr:regulatory protein RecX [Burkholderiales bacterium]